MTDREKMIDLIINAKRTDPETGSFVEYLADFLLGYGVKLPTSHPGKPLTLEQLREMDGQPAYWPEDESWGIVSVDSAGKWAGKPFFKGRKQEVNFEYDIESRGMEVYAYPPAHIDRSKWKPCEFCNGKTVLYQYTNSTKLFVNTFGGAATLVTECSDCPPYADCCMKDISANSAFRIKFCPECGRPLTEAAWAELERRLRG